MAAAERDFSIAAAAAHTGQYDYKADVILAICEGPITGIGDVWRGQSTTSLGALGLSLFLGPTPQAVWSYLSTPTATSSIVGILADIQPTLGEAALLGQVALAYQGTAYVAAAQYDLSDSATLDNHNFEVLGFRYATGYGQTPYSDNPGVGDIFVDADPALVVSDFLTNAQYGVGFPAASIDTTSLFGSGGDASYQTYCRAVGLAFSPALTDAETASSILDRWLQLTNSAAVWSGGLLRFIPYGDMAVTGNGVTFNPNVTPIYDLGDDDYIVENNADPLTVSRTDPYEAYNVWRVECADRNNAYNLTPVEARDQNAIELTSQNLGGGRGERIAPTVTAHEICDTGVALITAQLMLQRAVYIRNTYKFRLSWEYCLLDPMDLVTVTDTVLGLDKSPIRITTIEENENGYLEITAEEFPLGHATATKYATTSVVNVPNDRNVDPGSVADVLIFEPTDQLGGGLVIMAGACSANPLWGGCNIWLSYQNGRQLQPDRHGQVLRPHRRHHGRPASRRRQRHRADHRPDQHAVGGSDGKRRRAVVGHAGRRHGAEQPLLCRRRDRLLRDGDADGCEHIRSHLPGARRLWHGRPDRRPSGRTPNSPGSTARFSPTPTIKAASATRSI